MVCFATIGGEPLSVHGELSAVSEVREQLARTKNLKYASQVVFLLPDGKELTDDDILPPGGSIQVQIKPPPEGTWGRVMWDAANLDEELLREALSNAFPLPLSEIDFSADPPPHWRPRDYWEDEEKWARWTSDKMRIAAITAVGQWADYWSFADMADSYGYWMVEIPCLSKEKSIDMYVANVKHWRALLKDLDEKFANVQERTKGMSVAEVWEIAAAELLRYCPGNITETTFKYGFEMWYWPFVQVLEWFAQYAELEVPSWSCIGMRPSRAEGFFKMMLTPWGRGVFSSYSVKADGAKEFAERMAKYHGIDFNSFDATAQWMEQRVKLSDIEAQTVPSGSCQEDAHFKYICSTDCSRCPLRAERLKDALRTVRNDARQHCKLSKPCLQRWQQAVLGLQNEAHFRRTDAYAKAGRERYPHPFEDGFFKVLEDADDETAAPELRAARAYLDVCFFHPFDDGNARLARLVLDFVLTRAGLCLQDIGDLFIKPRKASDQSDALDFVHTLQKSVASFGEQFDDDLKNACLDENRARKPHDTYQWFDCVTSPWER
eukprot:TRINITY_DN51834_c0_g1_i1.p1 TRINITY_DN51834_c0_g1~~TRINITY_DN51834_c0_g1_i1.p1  ORF type:complete len:575 (-),score=118.96 TRINITY_DN51834_c0_g1_i1:56-1702(-)